ncbi:glycosyltransferase [Luteolibacter sp. SL250]|uniref:HAD family hydrolase n=1 Tax=Luteolibacter sp. SL250 TaxID=2995170 RepID=UPI00226FDF35|nr:HAD family hydrolase [Luteolibacter sp. SL250]WAC18687.1 glycosyltransferase [Luteolibacter sp. SL250]
MDLIHISIHGLIRGDHMELGRDPDTGGQCLYVLELVKALALDPAVDRVSLLTRRVADPKLSPDYARDHEPLGPKAEIVRIDAGPKRYLRKEVLWRHLDAFIDSTLSYLRKQRRVPDLIHAHYADAGYVGRHLAAVLGCPFIFTGHSLGRVKLQRLQHGGADLAEMEERYNLAARIEAEELSLDAANLVCTSTRQEVEEQYSIYHQYAESRMRVIPPGVDLSRFEGECAPELMASVERKLGAFLTDPSRVPILTIARADERKNLPALVRAFSKNRWLRENANLIVIGGNRDSFAKLPNGPKRVWNELLRAIDDADLYGRIAYPKRHEPAEIPAFYQWVEERGGVFVNPAFTEPFGLTLLEAAAGGLPLVATNDGGPRDILANCANGVLIDPMDELEMGTAIEEIAADPERRSQLSANGSTNVRRHYSWSRHVERYLSEIREILPPSRPARTSGSQGALIASDRWVVMDLPAGIGEEPADLVRRWRSLFDGSRLGLGIATGMHLEEARDFIRRHDLPEPGFLISSLGAEIHYGTRGVRDDRWRHQVSARWNRDQVMEALADTPGLTLQAENSQHDFKVSYLMDASRAPGRMAIQRMLRENGIAAKVMVTARSFVDVVPLRGGKDVALRYIEHRWGIEPGHIFYFAGYGNDMGAVRGRNLSVIPSDGDRILRQIVPRPRIYHAREKGLAGFFEGLEHYGFLGQADPPKPYEEPGEEAVSQIELHP